MKEALNKQVEGYNFVGLSEAFKKLLKNKRWSKWITLSLLSTMGLSTLFPLAYQAWNIFDTPEFQFNWKNYIPIIGLELVLIYFFRVILMHYHSIQTQIMQLELRQSLCQFIQNYVDYAKEMREGNNDKSKDTLDKFENLIFSSILFNPDKVPGTFDGIEGLSSFLEALKK